MGRDVSKLHPRLQAKIAELKQLCEERGLALGIGECYRTVAEQDALYAQGRTTAGAIVTNGRGSSYQSQHQWGIAFDFFRNVKGKEYSDLGFFSEVAAIAKSIGLDWGGDWVSFKDRPHLYLPDWGATTSVLKKKYGTPARFMATWEKAETALKAAPLTVLEFQKAVLADGFSLPKYGADGFWGQESEAAAKAAITKKETPAKYHNRTELVQRVVGAGVDGWFGSETQKLVKAWQKANGLVADGVVGVKTWKKMLGIA